MSSKLHEALSNLNQSSPCRFCSETKILLFWLVFVMPLSIRTHLRVLVAKSFIKQNILLQLMVTLLLNTNRSSNIFKYSIALEYSVHNHGKSKIQIFVLEGGKSLECIFWPIRSMQAWKVRKGSPFLALVINFATKTSHASILFDSVSCSFSEFARMAG